MTYEKVYDKILDLAVAVGANPTNENWNLLRAMFTAWCIMFDIQADTYHCDMIMSEITKKVGMDETEDQEDAVYNYMVAFIV